ncbi:MAG: hypothetical protein OQK98_11070 [Gammaproteobacteria bacterium]|nr:hypothetical protein [Gammaproteobacteria bacterium]
MKIIIRILIITLCVISSAQANSRLYQSKGDLPFVEMMLGMMTAMGMIDEVPAYLTNQGNYNNSDFSQGYIYQPGFNAPLVYPGQNPGSVNYPQNINKRIRLDGVWITQHGEMLGIKGRQFLWSDGKSRYLTGEFVRRPKDFSLKVSQSGYIASYQYLLDGNYMQTRDTNGVVRSFVRAPYNSVKR